MPALRLVRWTVAVAVVAVTASLAGVALPVRGAGSPAGRPAREAPPARFVRPLGHQSHGDAEGDYAPLSRLVAPRARLLSNT
ncbi:hypothetical protein ACFXA3_36530, partial [Streptomyces sp. NPDC059456]|uniref:hypothetical protein n=1 Tax=Streptomyces sp. NPDC059456 TaxID=3346838 RepID=UPI00368BD583